MSLRSDANLVRNATQVDPPENDEARIGGLFQDIADVAETVDSIADLKNYADAQAGDIVQVRSYNSGVDGGGGKFRLVDRIDFTYTTSSRSYTGSETFLTFDINTAWGPGAILRFEGGALVQSAESQTVGTIENRPFLLLEEGTSISQNEQGYIYRPYDTRIYDVGNRPFLDLPEGMLVESDVLAFPLRWERILEGEKDIRMWGATPNANWDSTGNDASKAFQAAQLSGGTIYVRPSNTGNYYNIDNPVEINSGNVTFEFEGNEDVKYNEDNNQDPKFAILYTNNQSQNFFDFFPNSPTQFKLSDFTFNGSITTYGVTNYSGRVFNYVLSASMRYHQYNLSYTGNWTYMTQTASFGEGGTVWYVDYYNTSTSNGFLSRATFDGSLVAFYRGLFISDNPTPEKGNFTNGYWCYFDTDAGQQPIKFIDGGGLSFVSSICQTRNTLPQSDKSLEPMYDLNNYGIVADVQIWDVRNNTTGRTTPQRGIKFYKASIPSIALNRTLTNERFGLVEGIEFTRQSSYLRNPAFNIPMERRNNGAFISYIHNTLIGIDLKGTNTFSVNHYNATGYDLDANLTPSDGAGLPSSDGIIIDANKFLSLCRHPGENIPGEPTFSQVRANVDYTSNVDLDNDFVEIVYDLSVLGTVNINQVDLKFNPNGASCKKVQIIGVESDGTTISGSKTYQVDDPTAELNEFITSDIEVGSNGTIVVRLIGYGDAGGGSIEIEDIAGYMERLENDNMALMPRTGGPIWNDVVFDKNGTGPVIESPDGTKYRITVDNAGALSATAV